MLQRSMLRRTLVHRYVQGRNARVNVSTAAEIQAPKPFSEIPQLPTLKAAWSLLPVVGKYKRTASHHFTQSIYKEYGPMVRTGFTTKNSVVHLFEPEDFETVYRNGGRYPHRRFGRFMKQYREERKDIYSHSGITISNGKEWYDARSKVQPHMMKPKVLNTFLDVTDTVARDLVDSTAVLSKRNGGEIKDYLSLIHKWALESLSAVMLDTRLGCLDEKPNEETVEMIRISTEIVRDNYEIEVSPFQMWRYFNTPLKRKLTKNADDIYTLVYKYVKLAHERLATLPENHERTFLESLLSTDSDQKNITAMIISMLHVGIHTTGTTAALALHHLAKNPQAQERAYQEVKAVLQDNGMTAESLNNIKYLKACLKESLRLTPTAIGIGRVLTEDTIIRGYHVPAGVTVAMSGFTATRSEKYFDDPHTFRPERFLREEIDHHPFAFLPFGFGPRTCLGKRIAEMELHVLLMRILERFRVENHIDEIDLMTGFSTTPDRPLDFQFYDR